MSAHLQNRFARLEEQKAAILSSLEGVADERLNRPRDDGGWSAVQVMVHLITVEKASLVAVRKRLSQRDRLGKTGMVSALKSRILGLALRAPLRIKAPDRISEVPERQSLETTREPWDEIRSEWRELLGSFPAELIDQAIFRHPVVGELNLRQTLRFIEEHTDRHAKQIERAVHQSA